MENRMHKPRLATYGVGGISRYTHMDMQSEQSWAFFFLYDQKSAEARLLYLITCILL